MSWRPRDHGCGPPDLGNGALPGEHERHEDDPCHPHHHARGPWHRHWPGPGGWRRLRLYYGAHLHRRLFWWFGAAIFVTTLVVGLVVRVTAGSGKPVALLLFGLPALALWILSGKVARRLARPIYELVVVSEEIGRGNLSARARLHGHRIDELAVLARSMNDMAARIQRQLADQRELLAAVSHELRTPLGHLRVLLDIARDRGADGRTYDEIERELVEMDRLVGELLASARLDFQALSPKPLDAVDVATRALERAGLDRQKLVVAPELENAAGGHARFHADPTLVGRALANLIDNATRHGGGLRRLTISARPGFVVFQVEDGGAGFPPGAEARVFEPFARASDDPDAARPEGSLGLGLSLVARIARAHGGSVAIANRPPPERGARVTLSLAVRPPEQPVPAAR